MDVYHIVKVQRPLEAHIPWIVSDQLKARVQHVLPENVPEALKKLMGNDYKAFFKATWNDEDNHWVIQGRTNWRQW
jgi:hypothetical protein